MRSCLALWLVAATALGSAGPDRAGRVVLILLPAVSAGDLDAKRMPNFAWLAAHGSSGLMNSRTAAARWPPEAAAMTGDPARASAYLTLGAGTRCAAGPLGAEAFARGDSMPEGRASEVYRRRNLAAAPSAAFELNPLELREDNAGLGYRADPGALGDAVHAHGLRTAVIGDADRPNEPHREAVLTAMDAAGGVDAAFFDVSEPRSGAPFGRRTALAMLDRALEAALERARFVTVDWGDSARLDDQRPVMRPAAARAAGSEAMGRIDAMLGMIRRRLDLRTDRLLLVGPYPSRAARAGFDLLTPIVAVGGGPPGVLTSATTRRPGIVANVDLAPTVEGMLGTGPPAPSIVGRPMTSRPSPDGWNRVLATRARLLGVEAERRSVLPHLINFLMGTMIAFGLLFTAARGEGVRWIPLSLLLVPAAVPPALLVAAFVAWPSVAAFTAGIAGITVGIAAGGSAAARVRGRAPDGLCAVALVTVGLALADGVLGFPHMPYCILSYSVMEGARYYGIGNEFMGAFLAATALAATAWAARTGRKLPTGPWCGALALFLVAGVILAGPGFGAKFGGGLAAAGGFGFTLLLLSGRRPGLRQALVPAAAMLAAVAAMVVLDRLRGGGSSHIGRAFDAVVRGGPSELGLIVGRKAAMDLHLLAFSPWSRLAGWAAAAAALGLRSRWLRRGRVWPDTPLGVGIAGALVAAGIALAVDDAGALAAATALIYLPPAIAIAEADEEP